MQSNSNEYRGPPGHVDLSPEDIARIIGPNTVYVREWAPAALKDTGVIPIDAEIPASRKFFGLHAADGRLVAVVDNRDMAFTAARQHELEPVSVH